MTFRLTHLLMGMLMLLAGTVNAKMETKELNAITAYAQELTKSAQDPLSLSLPMLATSHIGDRKTFDLSLAKLSATMGIKHSAQNLWIRGRIVYALSILGLKNTEAYTTQRALLSAGLASTEVLNNDPMIAWAWAYRLSAEKALYPAFKKRLVAAKDTALNQFKAQPDQHSAATLLWVLGMNLYAQATNHDIELYPQTLYILRNIAKSGKLVDAIKMVKDDYPNWLMATVMDSAILMDDTLTITITKAELNRKTLMSTIKSSKAKEKARKDAMMALSLID